MGNSPSTSTGSVSDRNRRSSSFLRSLSCGTASSHEEAQDYSDVDGDDNVFTDDGPPFWSPSESQMQRLRKIRKRKSSMAAINEEFGRKALQHALARNHNLIVTERNIREVRVKLKEFRMEIVEQHFKEAREIEPSHRVQVSKDGSTTFILFTVAHVWALIVTEGDGDEIVEAASRRQEESCWWSVLFDLQLKTKMEGKAGQKQHVEWYEFGTTEKFQDREQLDRIVKDIDLGSICTRRVIHLHRRPDSDFPATPAWLEREQDNFSAGRRSSV